MIVALISVLQIWKLDGPPWPPCHIVYPNFGSAFTFCKPYWACLNKLDLNDCLNTEAELEQSKIIFQMCPLSCIQINFLLSVLVTPNWLDPLEGRGIYSSP